MVPGAKGDPFDTRNTVGRMAEGPLLYVTRFLFSRCRRSPRLTGTAGARRRDPVDGVTACSRTAHEECVRGVF